MSTTSTTAFVPAGRCPGVLLVYGEERANTALAGELELDGYRVYLSRQPPQHTAGALPGWRGRPGHPRTLPSPHRGYDVLRALRAGELAPGAAGVRVLWIGTSRETSTCVLRAFEAGADDVTRSPLGYAELLACPRARASAP